MKLLRGDDALKSGTDAGVHCRFAVVSDNPRLPLDLSFTVRSWYSVLRLQSRG